MATVKKEGANVSVQEELKPIEKLAETLNIATGIHEAVKVANGWKNGKQVTESQYKKAIDDFLNAPMRGGK